MKVLEGRWAVVTGAASGIGRSLALALARQGTHLALTDINESDLMDTAKKCLALGVQVYPSVFDVSDRRAFYDFADNLIAFTGGQIHIVVNNAGVNLRATVEDMTYEDLAWIMGINFYGVVYGTKAFLPHLEEMDEAHIVNVSSIFGVVGVPTQAAYCATKFAVRGFTESLTLELRAAGSRVGVTSVHPGGIKTNIVRSGRIRAMTRFEDSQDIVRQFDEKLARTSPDDAADAIIDAILSGRDRLMVGMDARWLDRLKRLAPVGAQRLLLKFPGATLRPRQRE